MYFYLKFRPQISISVALLSSRNPCKETRIHFFRDCPLSRAFWNNVKDFLVSGDLIEASGVLQKIKCLGLTGKEGDVLFSHCLLLARFDIFSCKYESSKPSIVELYVKLKTTLYLN